MLGVPQLAGRGFERTATLQVVIAGFAVAVLLLTAAASATGPAWRAMRVDPVRALRAE